MRDRWLSYDGVEDFCRRLNHKIVELPMVCHENHFCSEKRKMIILMSLNRLTASLNHFHVCNWWGLTVVWASFRVVTHVVTDEQLMGFLDVFLTL
jgi:hypothetical protein